MGLDVFVEVVTPHEPLPALDTHESLLTLVCPKVSLQLVRASETFPAVEPMADKWPPPVYQRMWARRWEVFPYTLEQLG